MMKKLSVFIFLKCFCSFLPLLANVKEELPEGQETTKMLANWDARLEYARLLSNLHRYDESLKQYEKLLHEKPDSIIAQSEIAQVMYYQKRLEEALQILEKIPFNELDSKGQILMGDIYRTRKDYSKAETIYREQLKKEPEDDLTRLKLAEMLSWQKNYTESMEHYEQILSRHPDDIQVRRKYALVLMWMGNDNKAAEELEKTLEPVENL